MLTTVKLYGALAEKFGKSFEFDLDTVAEAIAALDANLPGFRQHLVDQSEPGYRVIVDDNHVIQLEELEFCITKPRVIKIVPVIVGASDKSIGQIITGVVLLAAAFFTGGASLVPLLGEKGASIAISTTVGFGLTLVAGGISGLLSPVPTASGNNAKQANNYSFGRSENNITQGQRVPIICGRFLCEGYPVSVRLVVEHG